MTVAALIAVRLTCAAVDCRAVHTSRSEDYNPKEECCDSTLFNRMQFCAAANGPNEQAFPDRHGRLGSHFKSNLHMGLCRKNPMTAAI